MNNWRSGKSGYFSNVMSWETIFPCQPVIRGAYFCSGLLCNSKYFILTSTSHLPQPYIFQFQIHAYKFFLFVNSFLSLYKNHLFFIPIVPIVFLSAQYPLKPFKTLFVIPHFCIIIVFSYLPILQIRLYDFSLHLSTLL